MTGQRRKFRREGEERRRDQLIAAALDIIAECGSAGATVRAIAARAGVTQGLIRHYFQSKDELTRAAYDALMQQMADAATEAIAAAGPAPVEQLRAFVLASLSPDVTDARSFGLWSGFIQMVRRDPEMSAVHERNYRSFRVQMEGLIAALPRHAKPAERAAIPRLAIACTGVVDGLWLEASLLPDGFADSELHDIALGTIGTLLGVDLSPARAPIALPYETETLP